MRAGSRRHGAGRTLSLVLVCFAVNSGAIVITGHSDATSATRVLLFICIRWL